MFNDGHFSQIIFLYEAQNITVDKYSDSTINFVLVKLNTSEKKLGRMRIYYVKQIKY